MVSNNYFYNLAEDVARWVTDKNRWKSNWLSFCESLPSDGKKIVSVALKAIKENDNGCYDVRGRIYSNTPYRKVEEIAVKAIERF